jgi:hypothetical protein
LILAQKPCFNLPGNQTSQQPFYQNRMHVVSYFIRDRVRVRHAGNPELVTIS